jgi:hypothetical protein
MGSENTRSKTGLRMERILQIVEQPLLIQSAAGPAVQHADVAGASVDPGKGMSNIFKGLSASLSQAVECG